MRHHWPPYILILSALLAMPATNVLAQQEAVHWHYDVESAKAVAKQTGRLVLIHFWTPSCGPCMALNHNVFNQPGVANAIETQFVPVKLNADENSATATSFGITRVPTDVILTPDGQVLAKMISPPTPAAYVAEVTAAAGRYATTSGQAYARAAAAAPIHSQLNAAYANLPLPPEVPLAVGAQQQPMQAQPASPYLATAPSQTDSKPFGFAARRKSALAAVNAAPANPQTVAPQVITNPTAPATNVPNATPIAATAPPVVAPTQVANPYATTASPRVQQPAVASRPSPVQSPMTGYAASPETSPVTSAVTTPAAAAGSQVASNETAPAAAAPDPSRLPPGAPPLGFEGYCPVTMRNKWKWVPGDPRWGVVHRGRTYWFAGPEEQKQFWTDPDRYAPALSGMDPVLAIDHQQQVSGTREHSLDYDGMFYMFASEATLQQFTSNPQRYATAVRQAMGIPRGRLVR
ncbi:MAG TPA: thioredoxin family protein [Lacipirellulaceae bacterium]|nr:thioredoxin family protein [Lacipirellulaceae bacterium]